MPRLHKWFMCLAVLALLVASAQAQENPDIEKAKAHYIAAEAAVQAGDHARAAAEYAAAHEITKDPALFYKLASAYEQAGQCDQALVFYQRYLAEGQPDEQLEASTRERIASCQVRSRDPSAGAQPDAMLADDKASANPGATDRDTEQGDAVERTPGESEITNDDINISTAQAPPSFVDQPTSWKSKVAWSSLAAGVGLGIAGAVLALSASAQEQDLENLIAFRYPNGEPAQYSGTVQARYDDLVSKGKTHETWSRISFGAAGVCVGAAVVLFVLDRKSDSAPSVARVVPVVSSESVGLSAGFQF